MRERSEARVSNIRPVGQNRLGKDSSPAHWTALENYEEGMNFGLICLYFSFTAFPGDKEVLILHHSNQVRDKQLRFSLI